VKFIVHLSFYNVKRPRLIEYVDRSALSEDYLSVTLAAHLYRTIEIDKQPPKCSKGLLWYVYYWI